MFLGSRKMSVLGTSGKIRAYEKILSNWGILSPDALKTITFDQTFIGVGMVDRKVIWSLHHMNEMNAKLGKQLL